MDNNGLKEMKLNIINEAALEGFNPEDYKAPAMVPFCDEIIDFLNEVSRILREDREAKKYPDVVTFSFWIRKASMMALKERFIGENLPLEPSPWKIGRGTVFHIAPSNVPVNYAYSLVAGLVCGNVNIVRIPSKDFPQVDIINRAFFEAVNESRGFDKFAGYIHLVRYDRSKEINDFFSSVCDVRVIWGGDNTIAEIRKSPLPPRSTEVTFADRYSLAIIDAKMFGQMDEKSKKRLYEEFYNDTFLTDQNACTSPRIVVWSIHCNSECALGELAKTQEEFWKGFYELVALRYTYQPIMGVNKLTSAYLMAAGAKSDDNPVVIEKMPDNLITRVKLTKVDASIMELKDNSGYFFEYDCDDLLKLHDLCDNLHCQTIGYLGKREDVLPLLMSGIKGVDRVVPIGKTMDFDFYWDGYNLFERLTRIIDVRLQ